MWKQMSVYTVFVCISKDQSVWGSQSLTERWLDLFTIDLFTVDVDLAYEEVVLKWLSQRLQEKNAAK